MERYYQYYLTRRKDEMRYKISKRSLVGRDDDLFNLLSVNNLSVEEYQRVTKSALSMPFKQSFQSAAKAFIIMNSLTQGVVVPYKEGEQIINDLCQTHSN